MAHPHPPFYDNLDEALPAAWAMLAEGVAGRRSGFHTLSVATLGLDGRPRVRVVVSRAVDPVARTVRFHCDRRSDKADEIRAEPRLALLGYDAPAKIQVRLEGRASLHIDDVVADEAWAGSRMSSRVCYGTVPAPGSLIPAGGGFSLPADEAEIAAGRPNFCAVLVTVERLEFLYLAHSGHRRARFTFAAETVRSEWLAP